MLSARNIHFEMAQRGRAINCGGIGAREVEQQVAGLPFSALSAFRGAHASPPGARIAQLAWWVERA